MLFTSQLELNVLYTRDTVHFLPSKLPSIFQWSRSKIVVHVINSWLAVLQFVSSHTADRSQNTLLYSAHLTDIRYVAFSELTSKFGVNL